MTLKGSRMCLGRPMGMKRALAFLVGACAAGLSAEVASQEVSSPDGRGTFALTLDATGAPFWRYSRDGKAVVGDSRLGFLLDVNRNIRNFSLDEQANLTNGFRVVSVSRAEKDETWRPVWGEEREIRENYRELAVDLRQDFFEDRGFTLRARIFDDGVGFRYEFPRHSWFNRVPIREERTEFRVPGDTVAWWIPGDYDTQEYSYTKSRVDEIAGLSRGVFDREVNMAQTFAGSNVVQTALMTRLPNGLWANFHEAACVGYPTMHLEWRLDRFVSHLTPSADGSRGRLRCPFATPWRTVIVGERATDILASRLTLNLNEPCALADTSWIRPQKYVGMWWVMITGRMGWAYERADKPHGAHTEHVRKYIDFAAEHGFGSVLVEGWNMGFENGYGAQMVQAFDQMTPTPDYDLVGLHRYAAEKGVGMMLYQESGASPLGFERCMDRSWAFLRTNDVRSVKIGYVGKVVPLGENHYSQWMNDHYLAVVRRAAEFGLMVNMHEAVRPTGLCRTYPNLLCGESARGTEYDPCGGLAVGHATCLPFTRLVGGPMDFTPGILDAAYRKSSTLSAQLSLYVTLYSPLQMAADTPEVYARHREAFRFIKDVPVEWDETRYLAGEPGSHVTIARRKKDSRDWYVGSTVCEARRTTLALDFLDAGRTYEATVYRDADTTSLETNPDAYAVERKDVRKGDSLTLDAVRGGGWAMSLHAH